MLSTLKSLRRDTRKRDSSFEFEHLEDRLNLCAVTADGQTLCVPDLPDAAPAVVMRAADSINQFGNDLYQHFEAEPGNLFLSPFSIGTALAMTYAGADGETAAEIERVLHFGTEPGIHDSFRELLQFRAGDDKPFELDVANAQWPAIGFPLLEEFSDRVADDYGGTTQALDYTQTEQAKDTINAWVADKTDNTIQNLLQTTDLSPETVMVLTNAIHFDAKWAIPFDPMLTETRSFVRSPGDEVDVPTMYQESSFRYTEHDGYQILELPYQDGETSMVVFLPVDGKDTYDLPPTMLPYANEWLSTKPEPQEVDVWLPKFSNTVPSSLKNVLKGMGMPSAFGAADFSKMTPGGGVFITDVLHKAFIDANEQGTKAGAATAVVFGICFAAGTPVLTPDGEKTIETLRAGDQVLARDENNLEAANEFKVVEETFERLAETMNLHIGGQVIQTTSEHPFFVKGQGWTKAGELEAGNLLSTSESGWIELSRVESTGEQQTVYNMRVADHHTYFVGSKEWGFAVWAHNRCGDEGVAQFEALRPFHYAIRDNATSATLFMGRTTDPTIPLRQRITPSVQQRIAGDVDGSGQVDLDDLYIVSKNVNVVKTNAAWEDGDLDADGQVGLSDFIIISDFVLNHLAADMNRDGTVGFDDFLALSANFGKEVDSYYAGDFNVDGVVGFDDFLILASVFGMSS